MKSARFFLPAAFACSLALVLSPAPLRAAPDKEKDEKAHEAAADEVLKAMHMEAFFDTTTERMLTQLDRISDGAARQLGSTPEAADFQKRMHDQVRERIKKDFNWPLLKPEFLKSYAENFSTQELKELTAFYGSPLGQKLLEKQPELSRRMGEASQDRAKVVLPAIVQMVREESAKVQAAASPAPGAAPAGGPAALPAIAPAVATPPAVPATTAAPEASAAPKASPAKP